MGLVGKSLRTTGRIVTLSTATVLGFLALVAIIVVLARSPAPFLPFMIFVALFVLSVSVIIGLGVRCPTG
ncbi:MAG TPA: hypothetical protein VLY83_03440 [Methanoregula sp.]|nr:hypothetical protein [Methanoregula sp.]